MSSDVKVSSFVIEKIRFLTLLLENINVSVLKNVFVLVFFRTQLSSI
jgi:hypothetical protein